MPRSSAANALLPKTGPFQPDPLLSSSAAIEEKQLKQIIEWACLGAAHFRVNPECIRQHRLKLEAMPETETRLSDFENWRTSETFSPAEKLALALSRSISLHSKDETATLLETAKHSFNSDQIVHLCLSIVAVNDWIDLHSPSPIRILVVEDNDDDRELLGRQLDKAGLADHVMFLKDGLSARKLLETVGNPFQLGLVAVFLDLQLPGVSGLELLRCLREKEESKHFPVIVMTSSNDPSALQECESLKVASFIKKPITYQTFAYAVANIFHTV